MTLPKFEGIVFTGIMKWGAPWKWGAPYLAVFARHGIAVVRTPTPPRSMSFISLRPAP